MAIDINNADFRMFTDFAVSAKASARAQLVEGGAELNGTQRTVRAASNFDFIGNVKRGESYRTANDNVRQVFRDTIAQMFGGEDHIPEGVLKAMKLQDFGKGKPLTARRINEVKAAIVAFKEIEDNAIETLSKFPEYQKAGQAETGILHAAVHDILASCSVPEDAKFIGKHIKKICLTGDNKIRDAADIKARADALKANLAELRATAKGNQRILNAGKIMMESLAGKSLPQGTIGKLVEFALGKDVKMNMIKRLKADTGPVTITKALFQMEKNIQNALASAKLNSGSLQSDEANPVRDFVAVTILQRQGNGKLGNILKALSGENAAQLMHLGETLRDSWTDEFPIKGLPEGEPEKTIMGDEENDIPDGLRNEIKSVMGGIVNLRLPTMRSLVGDILGKEDVNYVEVGDNTEIPANTLMILEQVRDVAKEELAAKKDYYISQVVSGDGGKAQVLREILSNKIGEYGQFPEETVREEISNETLDVLNDKFSAGMNAQIKGGDGTAGLKSFAQIKLGGKELSGNVEEDKNEIAKFVTGGKTQTFASLQGPDLRKAQMLLSLISPESQKAMATGFLKGIYPDTYELKELFDDDKLTPEILAQAGAKADISMDKNGNLTVKLDNTIPVEERFADEDSRILPDSSGRTVQLKLGFNLEIKAEEFESLAKSDKFALDPDKVSFASNFKADFDKDFVPAAPKAVQA